VIRLGSGCVVEQLPNVRLSSGLNTLRKGSVVAKSGSIAAEPELAVTLVLAVARIGELDQAGWWRCHGLSTTGRYVLASSFPRTWQPAALELDVASATKRHEDLLPRDTALHLFSDLLPFRRLALAWLAERKTAEPDQLIAELQELDEAGTRRLIEARAAAPPPPHDRVGNGLLLGRLTTHELEDGDVLGSTVRSLAASYIAQGAELVPPYFDLVA
jgi:hypothetical protein